MYIYLDERISIILCAGKPALIVTPKDKSLGLCQAIHCQDNKKVQNDECLAFWAPKGASVIAQTCKP